MANKQAVVVIIDVSSAMGTRADKDTVSRLEDAQIMLMDILKFQLKVASKQNQIGIVAMNHVDTDNIKGYVGMNTLSDLDLPNLDMLADVQTLRPCEGEANGDVGEAILLARALLVKRCGKLKFAKRVVVLSDFAGSVATLQTALDFCAEDDIAVELVGIDFDASSDRSKIKTDAKRDNETLVEIASKDSDGVSLTMHDVAKQNFRHLKKKVATRNKFLEMQISPKIKLQVNVHTKVMAATLPSMKKLSKPALEEEPDKDPDMVNSKVARDLVYRNPKNPDDDVAPEDRFKGYKYGSQIIPFGKADEMMNYHAEKGIKVLGFVASKSIPLHYRMSNSYTITANPNAPNSQKALSALVVACEESEYMPLVRYCDRDGGKVQLGALIPSSGCESVHCFYFVRVPCDEDVRVYPFASVGQPAFSPSPKQRQCARDLVKNMDLGKGSLEKFRPEDTFNPVIEHFYDALLHRAQNPSDPIPDPRDEVMSSIKPDKVSAKLCEETIKDFKELFPIKRVEKAAKIKAFWGSSSSATADKSGAKPIQSVLADTSTPANPSPGDAKQAGDWFQAHGQTLVDTVGSVHPVKDFQAMLARKDKDLSSEAVHGLTEQIKAFVGPDGGSMYFTKAMACLVELRKGALQYTCELDFNTFLTDLKEALLASGDTAFWELVKKGNITLINQDESNVVDVTAEQANAFLTEVKEETDTTAAPASVPKDDEDLFDDFE